MTLPLQAWVLVVRDVVTYRLSKGLTRALPSRGSKPVAFLKRPVALVTTLIYVLIMRAAQAKERRRTYRLNILILKSLYGTVLMTTLLRRLLTKGSFTAPYMIMIVLLRFLRSSLLTIGRVPWYRLMRLEVLVIIRMICPALIGILLTLIVLLFWFIVLLTSRRKVSRRAKLL